MRLSSHTIDLLLTVLVFALAFVATAALAGVWWRIARWFAGGPL